MRVQYLGATDAQVRWGGNDDPRLCLIVGALYEVQYKEVHSWHTTLFLATVPRKRFNAASFAEVPDVSDDAP